MEFRRESTVPNMYPTPEYVNKNIGRFLRKNAPFLPIGCGPYRYPVKYFFQRKFRGTRGENGSKNILIY